MIHPLAWLIWLAAELIVLSATRNPLYMAFAIACTVAVLLCLRGRVGDAPTVPLSPLRFGLVVLPLAALFNALTVHMGRTVLLRLPTMLPLLGGPITLEALTFGALNGLALTGIYAAFVVLNDAVAVRALVGLIPRAFFPVAVVTSIALTFVPVTLRHWQQIREAQAIRGHRIRGLRDWLPLFLPLLIGGLEHAFQLAEAMTARGFAGAQETAGTRRARMVIAAGLPTLLAGWVLWLVWQQRMIGIPLMALGGAMAVASIWWLGRQVPRTTYRPTRWYPHDTAIALASGIAAAAFLVAWPGWDRSSIFFYPYPALVAPGFNGWIVLALGGLLAPVLLIPSTRHTSLFHRARVSHDMLKRDAPMPEKWMVASAPSGVAPATMSGTDTAYPPAPTGEPR
jgi:energy-coupling factor transport system permease protein